MKEKEKPEKSPLRGRKVQHGPPETLDSDIAETSAQSDISVPESRKERDRDIEHSLIGDFRTHEQKRSVASTTIAVAIAISLLVGLIGGVAGSIYIAPYISSRIGGIAGASAGDTLKSVVLDENSAIIDVVDHANPAVVSIIISKDLPKVQYYDPFGGGFFSNPIPIPKSGGATEKQQIGAGSGFIASSDGMIITNKHVVADPAAEYTVITSDGKKYPAKVLARDPLNDLAVVKIEAKSLPVLEFGNSDDVKLGQRVIAIGNTLGEFTNTVTTGVVSGKGRTITAGGSDGGGSEQLQEVLQTDAAINPGNSGGPLLNLAGQVIGVNTAVDRSGQLVGFAIPSSEAKKVLEDVKKVGRVLRPYLGVRYVMLTPEYAKSQKLDTEKGALVIHGDTAQEPATVSGSPAEKAGLVEGDIILEISGKTLDETHTLSSVMRSYKPGDQIVLKIKRGKDIKDILVTLGEAGSGS